MIIILKQDITNTQKDKIKSVLKENGLSQTGYYKYTERQDKVRSEGERPDHQGDQG